MLQAINKTRRARNKLRKELGLTMKQLKKRKILKSYEYINGVFVLSVDSPGGQVESVGEIADKLKDLEWKDDQALDPAADIRRQLAS